MEGNGEGMVAVVHGLRDADLAVTLMSRRCGSQGRKVARVLAFKNQILPQTKSSVETNTYNSYDVTRSHAGVQICDDRYTSSYQLAHCRVKPTSPPISLSEFPPQRTQPNRTQGNFEIGGIGSVQQTTGPIRTQYSFRSNLRWANKRSVQFSRAACQTDPFAHSLRRYPTFPPSRSISADIIERLIKHTQAKNFMKSSKISKSMRSLPKVKTDEHTDRQEYRPSKNIQTYTRTKNEYPSRDIEKDGFVRRERSYRMSFSGDRRHKKYKESPINPTYDYLKGNSSLYRKRHERFTDVRYLDNLAKYIKDTLQQICDDEPVVCPKIQSRYNQHRKNHHPEQSSFHSIDADDQAAPSGSRAVPSTSVQLSPGTCKKNCPKGRKICEHCRKPLACPCIKTLQTEAATSSPSVPTASKFCQCLPEDTEPGTRSKDDEDTTCPCTPGSGYYDREEYKSYDQKSFKAYDREDYKSYDQKELGNYDQKGSKAYDQSVGDEVTTWINELPVKAGDTSQNVATRQKIGRELTDVLKNIHQDDNFDDNVMNEAFKYLDKLPIWLPDNKSAQDVFKDLMARNLLDKLKKIPDKPDKFVDTIKKWVNDIDFKKDVDRNNIANDFIDKLKPVALNRPTNTYDYAHKMKEAIIDILKDLSINTKGDKEKTLNELADNLINKLVSLPVLSKKADKFADTIKQWVNDINMKKDIDKNKVANDFVSKLKPIALNRTGNNNEYAQKLRGEIKKKLEGVPVDTKGDKDKTINELTDKLIDKLVNSPKDAVKPEYIVKSLDEAVNMINDWLDKEDVFIDFPYLKNSKTVEDLAKKLHDLQANGVDENVVEEMKNVVQNFLKNDLGITDPDVLDKLTNKLLYKFVGDTIIMPKTRLDAMTPSETLKNRKEEVETLYQDIYNWMKNQPETSHLDPEKIKELSRELANQIYDNKSSGGDEIDNSQWLKRKLSDIGEGRTAEDSRHKRKLVLNEIDDFLADAITDVPTEIKEELKHELADMLIKNKDEIVNYEVENELLEDETDRLIDKLFEGVRYIYAPDKPVIKVEIPKITKETLHEGIDDLLNNISTDIKNKGDLKTNLMNTLVDGVLKGEDEDRIKKEVYAQLRAANIPEDEAKDITQKMLDDTKDMKLALKSQDSTITHRTILSKAEPSRFKDLLDNEQKDVFVPDDLVILDKKRKGSSFSAVEAAKRLQTPKQIDVPRQRRSTIKDAIDVGSRRKSTKHDDELLPEELIEQMKMYNIDPNDKAAVARFQNALQDSKQGKGPLDKLMASLHRYSNLPKVPRIDKSKMSSAEYLPSLTPSFSPPVKQELIEASIGIKDPSLCSDNEERRKSKALTKSEADDGTPRLSVEPRSKLNRIDRLERDKHKDLKDKDGGLNSDGAAGSTESYMKQKQSISTRSGSLTHSEDYKRRKSESKTNQEIEKSLKDGIQNVLDQAKITVDDREALETELNSLLNQLVAGEVFDVTDDIYKLLRDANLPGEEARDVTNKLLKKAKDLSKANTQKVQADPLKRQSLDFRTKQKIKQSLKDDINEVLDKVKAEIEDRTDLETKLNTLLNQLVVGEVDDVKDDVYKALRKANIPGAEARDVTSKLLGKAKDLSEAVTQKAVKAGPSEDSLLDSKTKQEFKKQLKGGIHNALDGVKYKIDDVEDLEYNLLNTLLNQVETGDVEDVRDDVDKLLREANLLGDEAKNIGNKIISKTKDLLEASARKTKAGPSKSQANDSKTKQEDKQTLKKDIQKALDKVRSEIENREDLEANLLNIIINQGETGDVENVRDDVYRQLRRANIPQEHAKDITNEILGKGKDLSEAIARITKTGPSKSKPFDSATRQEIKQSLKADIQKALDRVKSKINNRDNLETNLLNSVLNQVEGGDVEDVRDDIYKLLRSSNIPQEQAKDITNKILDKGKDLSEAIAQKAKAGISKGKPLDSKTKQEVKQTLKKDIQKALDKVRSEIEDREDLEANLLNILVDQVETGDVENVRDDVIRQLRRANIPQEQAKDITNKILDKGKDLSEAIAQKAKAGISKDKPFDFKTKQVIKQSLKSDIQKALDRVKSEIDNRENLEANLLNTLFNQVEDGDFENVRNDVNKLLRNANIPQEQAKEITNKLLSKGKDLSEAIAHKSTVGPSKIMRLDNKAKQTMKADIQKVLDKIKSKIDDRENLEANLLNTILDQIEVGDVEDISDTIYKQLRSANIPREQAKYITNEILTRGKDLSESLAHKSKGKPLDYTTKQEIKQSLKADIQKALGKVKTKIHDKDDLETNILNTILNQLESGDVEVVRDDVYRLLRGANIPQEQAKDITNKLLGKGKDLSKVVAQKTKHGSSERIPLDSATKQEIKQSLKVDIEKVLDKVKTKIEDRDDLEANLLNTILNQVEEGEVEDLREEINQVLRNANIPQEQAKEITNKLLDKGKDLSDLVAKRMKLSRSDEDSFEDTLKSGKAYAQKRRPDDLSGDTYNKKGRITSKEKDALKNSIIGDVSDVIEGAPLPLSSHTKNVLKAKLSNALIKGLSTPYSKKDVKSKVLNILSEESIKLQGEKRPKETPTEVCQEEARRRYSSGRTNINESIQQEISDALEDAPTKIPKHKKNNLKKKLTEIVVANIRSDLNDVRMKILNLLTKETHLHKIIISDLTSDIIQRIIDVIKLSEIANRRKTKKIIYSLQIEGKKRSKLFGDTSNYDRRTRKRRNDGNGSSDDDKSVNRGKSRTKHDKSNLSQSISDHIDDTIAKQRIDIPQYKISEIKQKLENLAPKDILAVIRGDKVVKNKILDILINDINIKDNDANELINGVIKRFNESDDSQYSATSSQIQNMKGYLKGEILGLLEKYNVKLHSEVSKSESTSPSLQTEVPFSSTQRDDVGSPQMMIEPSLSAVYDDDEVSEATIKPSDRIDSGEYFNKITDTVDNWVEELPVDLNDDRYRNAMVEDLAGDIIERQKYLQLNPDARTSAKEELECLKYQVFRWLNSIEDVGDLTPMTPKIGELRDRINEIDVPLFSKSSKRHRGKSTAPHNNAKERTSDAFIDKFEAWTDSLPLKFKNEEEKQQYENLKYELFNRLKQLGPQARPRAIKNEIDKFLSKVPLDPKKKIDLDDKILELTGIVQTTEPSNMEVSSFESKTGYKKLPNLLYDFIENWCDSLPFDDSLDQDTINIMKHNLTNKMLQKICQLNLNPEILNDDFLYEDVLRDELDNLFSDMRNYIRLDDDQLAELKDVLVNKIKEAKQKTQNERTGQMYKQQLRDAVSRTLPPGLNLTTEDQTSLEVLKDAVADAFINLNYVSKNEELRNKLKKKIADEVTRFCNHYLQRHPTTPLCSNKLNQELYAALKNVSLPNDESMRSEVEHVRMKELIIDWVKGLPLAEQTPTGQSTLTKMISVLAKRLHDLEHAGQFDYSDYTEEMKKEIKKWLGKVPLLGGKEAIDHYAADLIERLKNTEDSRKFDASMRIRLDGTDICPGPCHYALKERPKPKPCPDTCIFTPQFPSSLTREDREHLDRIKERVQQAKSKLAKRPCRDASPSPCIDTGSQTDIRPYGSIKSIPSVCPGPLQRPYKAAASRVRECPSGRIPCETPRSQKSPCPGMYATPPQSRQGRYRMDGASPYVDSFSPCDGSYSDMQPQIIVKEYYWDSTGNSSHQIPNRTPCDTFQGAQEPRSHCSRPSPSCRAQPSQPHTVPQSPQISSSDQENRRPRPEPSTSRYYKEKVTRLGSLDDMRAPNMKEKQSENFEWGSVRFPEDDDFWGPCPRPMIVSDDDYSPFSRERERKEERVRCRCRERVLTKCATKRRNRYGGSCNSCNNDPSRRCAKCNPVQCPHPSYLYFRK